MKYFTRFTFVLSLAAVLLVAFHARGTAQTVDTYAGADSLEAGDLFNYSISLKKDQAYDRVIYPDSSAFPETFEMRKLQRYSVTDFKDSLSYELQFWGVASDTLPALPVQLVDGADTTVIFTRAIPMGFRTVLQSEEEEMRPLKPIFDFAAAWWPWIAGILLVLLAAGAFYWYYLRQQDQPEPEPAPEFRPEPFLNPLKELENDLRQIKNVALNSEERFKDFYIRLGDAIRRYFEQLYRIPALESTSRELIYELNRRAIDDRLVEQTRIVLREADMVKFAKFTPTEEQARTAYRKAEEFLTIAKSIHGSRIQQMRRQHLARLEEQRKAFNKEQMHETEVNKKEAEV